MQLRFIKVKKFLNNAFNTYNATDTTIYIIILSFVLHISKKKLEDFSLTTKTYTFLQYNSDSYNNINMYMRHPSI